MTAPERPTSAWVGLASEASPAREEAASTDDVGGERYRLGGELGAGGMGRVRAAYDTRLARELAVKQPRATGDASAEAALWREARITAELDHPGIIAVLDADHDADGAPFYAMRVVHGDGLDELVAARPQRRARSALARAVLSAAQAIAYAHAHGVVHRDLSPRNLRIGRHGEVVVMDWGLAARLDDAARGGTACGTPGFRAPELARGEPSGPPADVWSLGALLYLVEIGTPPPAEGAVPRGTLARPLHALIARALAPTPADRYPDAGAFAADLAAWLEGEPVRAHRDGVRDRVARLVRRHPGALVAGAAGLAAVAVVAIVLGTFASRRGDEARRSRGEAQSALRTMLIDRLGAAVRADRRDEVERLAAEARKLGAVADARGAAAAFAGEVSARVTTLADEAGCRTLDARGDGSRICVESDRVWIIAGSARHPLPFEPRTLAAARMLADGGVLAVVDDDGPRVRRFDRAGAPRGTFDLRGGVPHIDEAFGWAFVAVPDHAIALAPGGDVRDLRPCPSGIPIRVFAASPATRADAPATVAICADGTLVLDGGEGEPALRVRSPELTAHVPTASAGAVIGTHLVTGGADGRLALVELASGKVVYATGSSIGDIEAITPAPTGEALVVSTDAIGLWRPMLGTWRDVRPRAGRDARGTVDGAIVFGGGAVEAWSAIGPGEASQRISALGGLAAVAWSHDGAHVVFGGGDGVVYDVMPARGDVRRARAATQVIKSVAFAPDDASLAIGSSTDGGLVVVDAATLAPRPSVVAEQQLRVRRLAFVGPDVVAGFTYHARPSAFDVRTGARVELPPLGDAVVDVAAAGEAVYALDARGGLWRYTGARQTALAPAPGATALAASHDGRVLALVLPDGTLAVRTLAPAPSDSALDTRGVAITAIALTPAGDRVALGRSDGSIEVWTLATRELVLRVRAHAARVGALAFDPSSCRLATAGWDAVGRILDVCRG